MARKMNIISLITLSVNNFINVLLLSTAIVANKVVGKFFTSISPEKHQFQKLVITAWNFKSIFSTYNFRKNEN